MFDLHYLRARHYYPRGTSETPEAQRDQRAYPGAHSYKEADIKNQGWFQSQNPWFIGSDA